MGARKRMIDPGIWGDEGFLELSEGGRLFFMGLISQADDEGRGAAASKSLKAKIFPADDKPPETIEGFKTEVSKRTHTVFYQVGDVSYYALLKWKEYQSINHPQPSVIPGPPAALVALSFKKTVQIPDKSGNVPGTVPESGEVKPETTAAVLKMAEGFFEEERTA